MVGASSNATAGDPDDLTRTCKRQRELLNTSNTSAPAAPMERRAPSVMRAAAPPELISLSDGRQATQVVYHPAGGGVFRAIPPSSSPILQCRELGNPRGLDGSTSQQPEAPGTPNQR